jgi:hypothetical protein
LQENRGENYINRILSLDFTYTVFFIRALYQPKKENKNSRYLTIKTVKSFYREWPAQKDFKSTRYTAFYFFMMLLPVFVFDFFASILFA